MKTTNGTVTIPILEFDYLRDFVDAVENEHTFYLTEHYKSSYGYESTYSILIVSKDELIKRLTDKSNKLTDDIVENSNLILKLKKMSIWQFMKWRKQYENNQ